jgi:ABC-2 type transport system ATP-binding protein
VTSDAPAAEVRGLTKVYSGGFRKPAVRALDGVDLRVARGALFGLLGPNGAGKTTLVKVLLGICRRTGGEAFLLGAPAPDARVRRRVGYLPEGARFPGHASGEQALDLLGALSGLGRRERRTRAAALLDRLGLDGAARARKVRSYSKGMAQRLGLAQALIADPELILLDEPTDGVDPVGRREIRDLLLELRSQGKTVIINSHILSEIELVCDRVAVLNGGRLLYEGGTEELTATRGEWEVEVAGAADGLAGAIAGRARFVRPLECAGGRARFLVGLAREEDLDGILDLVRGSGARLRGLAPHKASLEERVVGLLRAGGAAAAPARAAP